MRSQAGFFDNRLERLSDLGDQLEVSQAVVDFEMFRTDLTAFWFIPMARKVAGRRLIL